MLDSGDLCGDDVIKVLDIDPVIRERGMTRMGEGGAENARDKPAELP